MPGARKSLIFSYKKFYWLLFVIALLIYFFLPSYIRWEKANESLREYCQKNEKLREENLKLKKEIWRLQHDPLYIEETTRKEMGYAKEGEVIYEIEREDEDSGKR